MIIFVVFNPMYSCQEEQTGKGLNEVLDIYLHFYYQAIYIEAQLHC